MFPSMVSMVTLSLGSLRIISPKILLSTTIFPGSITSPWVFVSILKSMSDPIKVITLFDASM